MEVILYLVVGVNLAAIIVRFIRDKKFYEDVYQKLKEQYPDTNSPGVQNVQVDNPRPRRSRHCFHPRGKYVLVKNGNVVAEGTVRQIAKQLGVKLNTVTHYGTRSYMKVRSKNSLLLVSKEDFKNGLL